MHATPFTIAGNAPAQPAGQAIPAGPDQRFSHQRFRRAASLAAIVFALAALLGLAYTACRADRSGAALNQTSDRGNMGRESNMAGMAVLTIDDLPATLQLSPAQRTQLMTTLTELQHSRNVISHRFGRGGRGRGQNDVGPGWRGKPGPRAGLHRDNRPGSERGPGRGYGPRGGPGTGFEPPMIGILEKASSILSGDQFVVLAQFLAGRRAEMGAGPGGLSTPFDRPFGRLAARRLGLTDTQQDQLKPVFTTFGDGLRQVRDGIEAGTMTPEQARDRAKELRLTLERGAQQILTPEQWKQVQTFREGRRDRQSDGRAEALPQRVDRITGVYVRVLGLEDAEASQVRRIMEATIPARRAAAERRAQGILGPEDFAYEMMTIEKNAAGQVRGVLTPDQAKRFDALLDLLPRGPQMGGPMGGPMGGRMGGRMGGQMGRHKGEPTEGPGGGPMGRQRGGR